MKYYWDYSIVASVIEGSLSYAGNGYKQESLKMGNIIQRKKVHRKEESLARC